MKQTRSDPNLDRPAFTCVAINLCDLLKLTQFEPCQWVRQCYGVGGGGTSKGGEANQVLYSNGRVLGPNFQLRSFTKHCFLIFRSPQSSQHMSVRHQTWYNRHAGLWPTWLARICLHPGPQQGVPTALIMVAKPTDGRYCIALSRPTTASCLITADGGIRRHRWGPVSRFCHAGSLSA